MPIGEFDALQNLFDITLQKIFLHGSIIMTASLPLIQVICVLIHNLHQILLQQCTHLHKPHFF